MTKKWHTRESDWIHFDRLMWAELITSSCEE